MPASKTTLRLNADGALRPASDQEISSCAELVTTNIVYLQPTDHLPSVLSNAPNNTAFKLSAGTYTVVPSKVLSNGVGGINIFSKTNITIEGIPGLTILDGSSALGEILYLTNCDHIAVHGLTIIGMVVTNYTLVSAIGHVWGSFGLYDVQNLAVENCRFIDGHDHGIHDLGAQPNWNAISTNIIVIKNNYFENFGGSRTNEAVQYDGTAIVPTGWLVEGNEIVNCLRGVEPYSQNDRTPNVFYNCVIRSNRMFNTLDAAILTAGSTNGHKILVEGNYIYNEPGFNRRGTNYFSDGMGISMNAGQGHIIRSNYIFNAPSAGISIGGGPLTINNVLIEGNRIEKVDTKQQGVGIATYATFGGEISDIIIRNNWIEQTKNYAMHLLSIRNGSVENNTIIDPTTTFSSGIKINSLDPLTINSNLFITGNTIIDRTTSMTSGIEITSANKSVKLEDNCISGATATPISNNAGAETFIVNLMTDCRFPWPAVRINEWMIGNTGIIRDPADNDPDDWFELYNPNNFTVRLGGYFLTADVANPFQFAIPNNGQFQIPPGGFLVVWADDEVSQNSTNGADLHANFKLLGPEKTIGIFGADGAQIDTLNFSAQADGVSEGRYPDGTSARYFMATPTPGTRNIDPLPIIPPRIKALTFSGGAVTLSLDTIPGYAYRVEYKNAFNEPDWTALGIDHLATSNSIIITNEIGADSQRFYRALEIR